MSKKNRFKAKEELELKFSKLEDVDKAYYEECGMLVNVENVYAVKEACNNNFTITNRRNVSTSHCWIDLYLVTKNGNYKVTTAYLPEELLVSKGYHEDVADIDISFGLDINTDSEVPPVTVDKLDIKF